MADRRQSFPQQIMQQQLDIKKKILKTLLLFQQVKLKLIGIPHVPAGDAEGKLEEYKSLTFCGTEHFQK